MDGPWQIGHTSAIQCAMLTSPPEGPCACQDPTFGAWEETVLDVAWDVADFLYLHAYYDPAEYATVGRYPQLWRGPGARAEDRRSVAELAACLVAYNVDPVGRVTPRSCYRGFERFSFGQKQRPSPLATALVASALRRVDDLAGEIAAVDVLALGSSKGGSGAPRPPRLPRPPRSSPVA